jgi:hypothetical protein
METKRIKVFHPLGCFSPLETFLCFILTFFSIHILANKSLAQSGGHAGAYLRLGAGVRALGMGGAFVAVANDATAGYWNPAGLAQLAKPQLIGMYSLLALDRRYNYVAAAYPLRRAGTISLGWVNYGVANLEARDANGALTGEFANGENALLISCGKNLRTDIALGATVKLLRHDLAGRSASGAGYDLGVWLRPREYLALGASAQNLQTRIYWEDRAKTKETFPPTHRLGVQIKPLSFFNLSVDYEIVARQGGKWRAGGEFDFARKLALRAGNDGGAMAFGVSLQPPVSRQTLIVEYGLSQDPIGPGFAHQFSLLLKLGQPARLARSDRAAVPDSNFTPAGKPQAADRMIAEIIEVRPPYLIVGSANLATLRNGCRVKVYQSHLGDETGRYCGAGEALDVSAQYAIIKMPEEKSAAACEVGEKLLLKVVR